MIARPPHRTALWHRAGPATAACAAALALAPVGVRAQNITYSEAQLGVLDHDVHLLGGKEGGVDINPEIILQSPIADAWAAQVSPYLRWLVQPRPTAGGEINTSGYTSQGYFGLTWTWQLAANVLQPGDGITFGLFEGPSFNNGEIVARAADRESLGSHVLFREAAELGYRINPVWTVSLLLDHESNAGFARYNQSLNDIGARIGIRF
ncbi:MAG TPA: acyloxyacyl hydrolase [Stellaceae bacterium]|nr:acyloxyacyl hydrolase [Stellaceae bacterium]